MRFHRQKFISFWQNNRLNFVKLERIMFILIHRAGLNPVFTIKIVLKWPNNHFNSILLIWQCSICVEIHWKYFERRNLRIFYRTRYMYLERQWKKTVWMFEMKLKISSPMKYRIQNFPTSIGTFQRNEVSNSNFQTFQFWAFQLLVFSNRSFQLHVSEYFIGVQD